MKISELPEFKEAKTFGDKVIALTKIMDGKIIIGKAKDWSKYKVYGCNLTETIVFSGYARAYAVIPQKQYLDGVFAVMQHAYDLDGTFETTFRFNFYDLCGLTIEELQTFMHIMYRRTYFEEPINLGYPKILMKNYAK